MTKHDFYQLLSERIVILDGATGTELMRHGMPSGVCPEQWVLEHPEALTAVQSGYRSAGSDIVYVPSFGANRCKLAEYGLDGEARDINCRLARLSRQSADGAWCFGDIAPTGQFLAPMGMLNLNDLVDIYREQIAGLAAGGVDGLVIETMMDLGEVRGALIAARLEAPELPVIVTMTFDANGRTMTGVLPEAALVTVQNLGADAFGCNCSTGPEAMVKILERLRPYACIPIGAKPNAGMPEITNEGRTVFPLQPKAFAEWVKPLHAAGANFLGGCCGTTPEHIAAVACAAGGLKPLPPAGLKERVDVVASPRQVVVLTDAIRRDPGSCLNTELTGAVDCEAAAETAQLAGIGDERPPLIVPESFAALESALAVYPGRMLVNLARLPEPDRHRGEKAAAFFGAVTCN